MKLRSLLSFTLLLAVHAHAEVIQDLPDIGVTVSTSEPYVMLPEKVSPETGNIINQAMLKGKGDGTEVYSIFRERYVDPKIDKRILRAIYERACKKDQQYFQVETTFQGRPALNFKRSVKRDDFYVCQEILMAYDSDSNSLFTMMSAFSTRQQIAPEACTELETLLKNVTISP